MKRYAPKQKDLATADIIAHAVKHEAELSKKQPYVHLDLRHCQQEEIQKRFPNFTTKEPIPVIAAQHYSLGGITTKTNTETDIEGLFAAGECAALSVHGANALTDNVLLGAVVFGKQAGQTAREYAKQKKPVGTAEYIALRIGLRDTTDIIKKWFEKKGGAQCFDIKDKLQSLMDEAAGPIRTKKTLDKAKETLKELKEQYETLTLIDKSQAYNQELTEAIATGFLLEVAEATIYAAEAREESRGVHFRADHKNQDKEWLKHIIVKRTGDEPGLAEEQVRYTKIKP